MINLLLIYITAQSYDEGTSVGLKRHLLLVLEALRLRLLDAGMETRLSPLLHAESACIVLP